jgi:hypothetical protein
VFIAGDVETIAGGREKACKDGLALEARFNGPSGNTKIRSPCSFVSVSPCSSSQVSPIVTATFTLPTITTTESDFWNPRVCYFRLVYVFLLLLPLISFSTLLSSYSFDARRASSPCGSGDDRFRLSPV